MTQHIDADRISVTERYVRVPGLRTHVFDASGGDPTVVLLHGLSANANEFFGLVDAGLSPRFRVVAPDLRGRGRSEQPATGYRMADHAADAIALLDALGLETVVLGGHSFGALLSIFVAARHPERVSKVIVIDAAISMHPRVRELIKPSLDRLQMVYPSVAAYLDGMRAAPHVAGAWDRAIEGYYRAEIRENPDGTAQSLTSADAIAQALEGVLSEPWDEIVPLVRQPVLLLNAVAPYGPPGTPPLVPPEHALETARAFPDCRYVEVPGNHLTLVFGENARVVVREMERFIDG